MNIIIADNLEKHKLTGFQWKVLQAAMTIPFGETRSYQWVADQIGKPKAVRAVGTALRKNPFPLLVPCHRVIKSDGNSGKYGGCDDGRKKKLLEMEKYIKRHLAAGGRQP
ncbi:MAG: MGMT family protein [Candidatus Omnitrophota bacterium]